MTSTETSERVQVGDVFESSWGYDQTNVDYYRVVRTTGKTAWVVRIGATSVHGSEGFMCDRVVPNPDVVICNRCHGVEGGYQHDMTREPVSEFVAGPHEFDCEPSRHRITTGWQGVPTLKVRSWGVWAHRVTGERASYRSWYA